MVRGEVRRRSLGTRDKVVAQRLEAELLREAGLERAGFADPLARHRRRPMGEHVAAYARHLVAKGASQAHRREALDLLGRFLAARRLRHLGQLTHDEGVAFLNAERRRAPRHGSRGRISARTVNKARAHLRAFGRFLVVDGRLGRDPFVGLPALDEEADRVFERRALTPAELAALLRASPLLRRAAYLCAVTTGLRRSELESIRLEQTDLGDGVLLLEAGAAKNRRRARVFLPPVTVSVLVELHRDVPAAVKKARAWSRRGPDRSGFLLPVVPRTPTLYRDLEAAGVLRESPEGRIDFHSLRVTFATLLGQSGVPLVMAQKLMRHSTPVLTSNLYTKLGDQDRRDALAALPLPELLV